MMTRLRKYLFTLVLLALCLTDAQAQFKIYTRKARMADFPAKTTMVVLSGNDLLDIALKNEIKSRWRVSPFDFCYIDEINEIKKNSNFYILYLSTEKSGLVYLNLEKCGEKAPEEVMLPVAPGRSTVPAWGEFFPVNPPELRL